VSIGISIQLDGDVDLPGEFSASAADISDFREPLQASTDELLKTFDLNFDSSGSMFGGWVARKPQMKGGVRVDTWPLMDKTGELRRGFVASVGSSEASIVNFKTVGKKGWNLATLHQYGTSRGLPVRKVMGITEEDKTMIVKTFQLHIVGALRNITP
jgi:phage gpG-like protein